MPIIPAKCTNCGASLDVDNTKDAAICPHCGSAFIVEKAINNYNTTNHIPADTVNIYGGNGADFVIRAGTLEKYSGASTEVVIPNSVTRIGNDAFKGCVGLTSVTIPNSVTSIGSSAFEGCTGMTHVTIPNSVTSIESGAFEGCKGLTSITIPDSVTSIEARAFDYCTNLTSITIPSGVTIIAYRTFSYCEGLTRVTIPNSVTIIEDKAFKGCTGLTSITIPNSVTSIGEGKTAFLHHSDGDVSIYYKYKELSDASGAFYGCTGLTSITISNSVRFIGDEAFKGCAGLTSVTIPNSVTSIGHSAFEGCTGMTHVTIPNSVTSIGVEAFRDCTHLTTVYASEEWKKAHWADIPCLASYKPEQSNSGCYIATAVYGSYDCPQVWTLRRFRDDTLAETWYGRTFIRVYYSISPTLVKWFGHCAWFQKMWRGRLDHMVADLNAKGVEGTPYNDKNWQDVK